MADENLTFETSTSYIDKQFWDYFDGSSSLNVSIKDVIPRDQGIVITTYAALMTMGGLGNLAVLITLAKSRRRKSRVDLLMTHLAVADVCVTCGVIPLEIGWKYTNAWLAGNLMCKVLLVMRAFGLYLSSNVLVCISLDRYFAVVYPLRLSVARRRSKQMLYCAWAIALACSLPQSLVFRVKRHPHVAGFEQCVSFDAFASDGLEIAYNVFCACAMYFVPLLVITACYVRIFCEIQASSRELSEKYEHSNGIGHVRLRRSDCRVLERARQRTLRMTVIIVFVFALCWLPYATMAMWYMVDRESASRVPPRVQDLLFAMAVSNSCMNPLVYGTYTLRVNGSLQRLLKNICCMSGSGSDTLEKYEHSNGIGHVRLRRSDCRVLERARQRTLRMTVIIVFVFALCWLPYATMAMWYMVDRESASRVPPRVQDLLFAMAVSNSCMNPLVYGTYTLRVNGSLQRLLKNICCMSGSGSDTLGTSSSSKNKKVDPHPMTSIKNGAVKPKLGVRFADTSLSALGERAEVSPRCRAPA